MKQRVDDIRIKSCLKMLEDETQSVILKFNYHVVKPELSGRDKVNTVSRKLFLPLGLHNRSGDLIAKLHHCQ